MLKVADIRHTRAYEQLCLYAIACNMTPAQKGALVKKYLKNTRSHTVDFWGFGLSIMESFTWSETSDGWSYWHEVNNY